MTACLEITLKKTGLKCQHAGLSTHGSAECWLKYKPAMSGKKMCRLDISDLPFQPRPGRFTAHRFESLNTVRKLNVLLFVCENVAKIDSPAS